MEGKLKSVVKYQETLMEKINTETGCFTPSQSDKNLCYGGYPWCDDCGVYIHQNFLKELETESK